jgi:hypothetical protein
MKANVLKHLLLISGFILLSTFSFAKDKTTTRQKDNSVPDDSITYDLVVFEIGYETFLIQQLPMEFYSESYYKIRNTFYVAEWNIRYIENRLVGADQDQIYYDPKIDYGIDLEYKLYYFFCYYEYKYNITLLNRGAGC